MENDEEIKLSEEIFYEVNEAIDAAVAKLVETHGATCLRSLRNALQTLGRDLADYQLGDHFQKVSPVLREVVQQAAEEVRNQDRAEHYLNVTRAMSKKSS